MINKVIFGTIMIVVWAIMGTMIGCAAFSTDKKVDVWVYIVLLIAYEGQLFCHYILEGIIT